MKSSEPGSTLLTVVMRLEPDCVEDVQAMLDLLHEEVDEFE